MVTNRLSSLRQLRRSQLESWLPGDDDFASTPRRRAACTAGSEAWSFFAGDRVEDLRQEVWTSRFEARAERSELVGRDATESVDADAGDDAFCVGRDCLSMFCRRIEV